MKHTKGEWIENPKAKGNIIAKETERYIASCMGYSSNVNPDKIIEENLANAKLIAAAPELLEELVLLLKYVEDLGNNEGYWPENEQIRDCKRAIKKATQ